MNKKLARILFLALFLFIILLGACKLSLDPYKPQHGAAGVKFTLGSSSQNSTTNRAILSNSGYLYLISVKKEGATTIHGPFTPDSSNTIVIDNLEAGEYDHLFVFYSAKEFNLQKTLEKINAEGFSLELDSHPSLETALTNKNLINKLADKYESKEYLLDFIFSDTFNGLESTTPTEQYISLLSHYFNGSTVFGQKSNLNLKAGKTEKIALTLLPFANLHDIGPLPDNTFIINVQSEQEIERFISLPIATIFGESNTNFAIELASSSGASLNDFAIYNQNGTKQPINFSEGIESFNLGESLEYTANLSKVAYFYVRSTGNLNFKLKAKPIQPTAALTFTNVACGLEDYEGWLYVGFEDDSGDAIQGWLEASKNGATGDYFIQTLDEDYQGKDMYLLYSLDKLDFEEEFGNNDQTLKNFLEDKANITALLNETADTDTDAEALLLKFNGRALIRNYSDHFSFPGISLDLGSTYALRPIVASGQKNSYDYGNIEILLGESVTGYGNVLYDNQPRFVKYSVGTDYPAWESAGFPPYSVDCSIEDFESFVQVLLYDSKGEFLRTITKEDDYGYGYRKIEYLITQENSEFYVFIDGELSEPEPPYSPPHFLTNIPVYESRFVSNGGGGTGKTPNDPTTIAAALTALENANSPIVFITEDIEVNTEISITNANYSNLTIASWDADAYDIASTAKHRISPSSSFQTDAKGLISFTGSSYLTVHLKSLYLGSSGNQAIGSDISLVHVDGDQLYIHINTSILENNSKIGAELTQGGAIYSSWGSVYLSDTTIQNCQANEGGGIYSGSGVLELETNNLITNCKALKKETEGGNGGAIYLATSSGQIFLRPGSSITLNHAENLGGGIYLEKTATIKDEEGISGVTDNTAGAGEESEKNIYQEP